MHTKFGSISRQQRKWWRRRRRQQRLLVEIVKYFQKRALIKYDENTWRIKIYIDLFIFCLSAINHLSAVFCLHLFFFSSFFVHSLFLIRSASFSPLQHPISRSLNSGANPHTHSHFNAKIQTANLLEYHGPLYTVINLKLIALFPAIYLVFFSSLFLYWLR